MTMAANPSLGTLTGGNYGGLSGAPGFSVGLGPLAGGNYGGLSGAPGYMGGRGPLDSGNYGGLSGAPGYMGGAATNAPPMTGPQNFATQPANTPQYGMTQYGMGPLGNNQGAVSASTVSNQLTQSPLWDSPLYGQDNIFQAQFNPLINIPSQIDLQKNTYLPGRSNVAGQFGEGGFQRGAEQTLRNKAAEQGIQAAQKMGGENINFGQNIESMLSGLDVGDRTQFINHLTKLMGPVLSGVAGGYGSAISGATQLPS